MKKTFLIVLLVAIAGGSAYWVASSQSKAALERERQENARKVSELEAALRKAGIAPEPETRVVHKKEIQQVARELDPKEIIAKLQGIKIFSGAPQTKNSRVAIQLYENLIACGPRAVEPIKEFLLLNQEVDYDSWLSPRASRDGRISTSFVLPPSLRFGLLDVLGQIGGEEAEAVLAEVMSTTGRGVELAYLARVLQELSPNKYRDTAINAARELLSNPMAVTNAGMDRYDREYLFGVLTFFGDASFAENAQNQLTRADGSVDRGALRYLQQTLGEQALPLIAQKYSDPTTTADGKERLGRYALNFAGLNAQADSLWRTAIFDPAVDVGERDELIEDLNQDGFESTRNPTQRDLLLIRNRLDLITRYRQEANHPRLVAAFAEAERDLRRMLERAGNGVQ